MRVAIVANPHFPVPPQGYGGTEVVIQNLIKGLLEKGHEPILVGTQDSEVDCEVVPIVSKAIPYPKYRAYFASYNKWLKVVENRTNKQLQKILPRIDIIHSHGFDLSNFQDFPSVTTLHNMIQFEDINYYIKRRNLPFISISKNQQQAFPGLNYVGVVHNGEDPAQFPVVTKSQNYMCFLGRLEKEKAPHLAIQLGISLGVKVKIAGKLDLHSGSYFKEEIKPHLNHPLVEYLGELGFEDKVSLLANAKCYLHPLNWREPFGLSVIEAGYCGTPTLAMRRGSMPELIRDGKTGLLVEDFVEGYHQIDEVLGLDRAQVAKIARSKFNYERMTRDYLRCYKKVIKSYDSREPQTPLSRNSRNYTLQTA